MVYAFYPTTIIACPFMATARTTKRTKPLTTDEKAQLFFEFLCAREADLSRQMAECGNMEHRYHLMKADRAELRLIRDRFLEIFER